MNAMLAAIIAERRGATPQERRLSYRACAEEFRALVYLLEAKALEAESEEFGLDWTRFIASAEESAKSANERAADYRQWLRELSNLRPVNAPRENTGD